MLTVAALSYDYELESGYRLPVLREVSFEAEGGSYTSILGTSGCGKTTLLLSLAGLLEVRDNAVILDGLSPAAARQRHQIGFVFQKPVFFEWLTILENINLPIMISELEDNGYGSLVDRFSLAGFAGSYPHELSGGMLSRVALARALAHNPRYLFLDEAFNNLDEALREEINMDIQSIWLDRKMTVVSITHSVEEAVFMSDSIVVMAGKPSSIALSYRIPFQRPRDSSIRRERTFIELVEEVRQSLKRIREATKSDQEIP